MTLASAVGLPPTLSHRDYVRFACLLSERYGLNFPEKRRPDLAHGVLQAFAASTCTNLDEYYQLLFDPDKGAVYQQQLVNALTIGESHFFRNAGQFDALYQHVLPEIIERRRFLRILRIWCAGCAGGEEPYSIAIMLRELLPDFNEWAITILATDINTEALAHARRAQYSEWAFREARAKLWRPDYFTKVGNRYALSPEVSRMVTFAQLNLAGEQYPSFQTNTTFMDLILCRNVTIYFTSTVTQQVVGRFYDALLEGGWLVVGHAEHSLTTYRRFQARRYPNTILYQRIGQPASPPEDGEWPAATPPDETLLAPETLPAGAVFGEESLLPPESAVIPPAAPAEGDPLTQARELLSYGHTEQARDLLLRTVAHPPAGAGASALLGQVYANLGVWAEAERWCRQAIQLDNLALEPYYTLALVLQHQGRLVEALEAMKTVIYLDHTFTLGHYGLAALYHSQGRLPQALKSLDNARSLLLGCDSAGVVAGSGGITVGTLQQAITYQQQQWSAEATEMPQ